MSRIGLALSGGGFRATLYHLGVVRFLRDANILTRVSHITSVSGGSIMAAHLVLNWQRYTGSEQDYDEAASELLNFIRLDVRNRVLRRYPLAAAANSLRWFVQKGRSRRLTRAGLLESLYENFLYGDRCLYELPANPQLHILATNVNEGCLCSFTRSGILDERRMPNGGTRFESVPSALATISMAVTASSAFPGFFPPLQLTAHDVGADEGRFPPHLFTDGGVYDNLGVRMFRHIQKSWIGHAAPLRPDDFVNLKAAADALQAALVLDAETPLRRLAQLVKLRTVGDSTALVGIPADSLPQSLWTVIELDRLYSEPAFDALEPDDEYAANLHHLAKGGRKLDSADHHWLNRYLANAAFADAIHQDLIQSTQTEFDAVIVSDAGKSFTISRRTKGGGLVGTAMRASDILMDRVWQLENDFFGGEADFIFAPMSLRVLRAEDPTAILPEIQQQVIGTRTDLDRFSELEISSLAQHGYAVMRKVCRSRQDVFGDELPAGPPWDPTGTEAPVPTSSTKAPSLITQQARELQSSSQRSLFRHLLSWRDWPTYVYLPLALLLFVGLPILAYRAYTDAHRSAMIVDAIRFSNPDFELVLQLAGQAPIPGNWQPLVPEEVDQLAPLDFSRFRLITDSRILDLRAWSPDAEDGEVRAVSYRRMMVRRLEDDTANHEKAKQETNHFRIHQSSPSRSISVRCDARGLHPALRVSPHTMPTGDQGYLYEADFDLSPVPIGQDFNVGFEVIASDFEDRPDRDNVVVFPIVAPTDVATMWVLLPSGWPYDEFDVIGYDPTAPARVQLIEPTYRFEMADGSLFGWVLVAPLNGYTYECRWTWRHEQ